MANDSKTWRCGKFELKFDRPSIMGVLNVTPDSFSDGGEHFDADAAIAYGLQMLDEGADIIDVGGESTRPGFTPVSADEEARRVLPVVRALAQKGAIVSIDTRHVDVAKAAVRVGASIVNDVTGFTDPKMVEFVKGSNCGVIIMHAGEPTEETPKRHTAVQLDTSAAAFVAEKARAAAAAAEAEAAAKAAKAAKGRRPGLKLGGLVQLQLPAYDLPTGRPGTAGAGGCCQVRPRYLATAEAEKAAEAEAAAKAAEEEARAVPANDELAAIMARSARRDAATGSTSQLRRFTLPDSAPIMRRVMGFLSDQARALVHAGVARERICIDPGAGFGKDANEDIVISALTAGWPSLLSAAVRREPQALCWRGFRRGRRARARRRTYGVCLGRHPARRQHCPRA